MTTYKRFKTVAFGVEGWRYTKNGLMTKESRVPAEVMEQFEHRESVDYDDQPDKPRCLFCDAPGSRKRYLRPVTVDLCEHHYYSENIGRIAAQIREVNKLKEKKEREEDSANRKRQVRTSKRRRSRAVKSV